MATLFSHSSLPLWVFIVVIVVGSLVVLGTIAFFIRLLVNRRRQAGFLDTFGDENLPQRRVTVRRGRVVEQSKYLSLTGSKFGFNAFGSEGNDGSTRDGARSKSPFEWWNNVRDRSQSRNSQMTQTTVETSSIYGVPTSPNPHRVYQRRDFNVSTSSFGSAMKDDASVSVIEEPASPPPLVRNFSRSFSRQGYNSTFSPRIQTLSRIEESSPHNSMISERQSRIASYADARDTKSSTPSPRPGSSVSNTQFFSRSQEQRNSLRKSSLQYEASVNDPYIEPPAMAYSGSRSSFGDADTALPQNPKRNSVAGSTKSGSQSQITALPEISPSQSTSNYRTSRIADYPKRSTSKSGKVLRKKSLTKSALVSKIDS